MTKFILRKWQPTDAKQVELVANNKNIANNLRNVFPNPYSIDNAQWFINDCIEKGDSRQLARAIDVDGKAIGSISISLQNDVYEKSAELGYWLAEDYWGKGIMTQAVKLICKQAFDTFDIERIYAEPYAHNQGSSRVLEKAGFTYEGTMRNGVYKNGNVYSYCMYSLLKDEI